MPFLWARHADTDAVERAIQADSSIADVQRIGLDRNIGQFQVEWNEEFQQLIDEIVDQHGIMQDAEAANGMWYLTLKFVDQKAVQEFQEHFHGRGYDFELQRIFDSNAPRERAYNLTPEQREVLVVALKTGYFSIPREAQIGDLADELGISTNAVSQRLRRATRNLTENTLTMTAPDELSERE